jgi:frataxin-like iron-binding protein CyaY
MRAIDLLENSMSNVVIETDDDAKNVRIGEKLKAYIQKNCSEWVQESGGALFYRGTKLPRLPIETYAAFVRSPRADRQPSDTDDITHKIFNRALDDANSAANRSNSLFCTADSGTANYFSANGRQLWIVFPTDGYHYAFARDVYDWTSEWGTALLDNISDLEGSQLEEIENFLLSYPSSLDGAPQMLQLAAEDLVYRISDRTTVDEDLATAGQSDTEVMVTGTPILHISSFFYNTWMK